MLLTYTDLKKAAGGKTVAQVVSNLRQMKIKFVLRPDGKPISTTDAINARIKLRTQASDTPDTHQDVEI